MISPRLLDANLRIAPHQPATSLWRAVEIGHLLAADALPHGGRGLDLGCGDGSITQLVGQELAAEWDLVGLDPDEEELALAAKLGLYSALHMAQGDAIPEADASFDFVFSNSVLEHVPNLEGVLDEVARVTRPGGRIVATVPTPAVHRLLRGPGLLGRLATGAHDRRSYLEAIDRRVAHVNLWAEERWRLELGARGLDVQLASTYMWSAELRRWEVLANLTAGLLVRTVGRGRQPIEIQRSLGLRRSTPPAGLTALGRAIGHVAALGVDGVDDGRGGGCLLLVAVRHT